MPIMCEDNGTNDQSDKLMDVMHKIMAQVTVTQSHIEVIFQLIFVYKQFITFISRLRILCRSHCQLLAY